MKQVYCDWCQKLIPGKPQGPEEDGEQILLSRQVEGDSSDDYEEYDVHQECARLVMDAMRSLMMQHHLETHKS